MRKEIKSTEQNHQDYQPRLKVVETTGNRAQIEMEIDRHIKGLTVLIEKLQPADRKQYFSGLLAHLMNQPVESTVHKNPASLIETDLSCLPTENLLLIRELSSKLNELYCITGDID
jgi:hypothetical protein